MNIEARRKFRVEIVQHGADGLDYGRHTHIPCANPICDKARPEDVEAAIAHLTGGKPAELFSWRLTRVTEESLNLSYGDIPTGTEFY